MPGHWRQHPEFATSDGPLLYRTLPRARAGRRRAAPLAHVRRDLLPGRRLARRRLPRRPRGLLRARTRSTSPTLAGSTTSTWSRSRSPARRSADIRNRRNITGVLQHWDWHRPDVEPGRHLAPRPAVRHRAGAHRSLPGALPRRRRPPRPPAASPARLDSDDAATDRDPHAGRRCRRTPRPRTPVAAGVNELDWTLDLGDPTLWWPRALGDQPLTTVDVEVLVDGESSDRRQRRTGLRQVRWNDWVCSVNGERIFLKGANLLPTSSDLADVDPAADARPTSSRRSIPASTRCACTATSPIATPTTPPTNSACCCSRTSRCSGGMPVRSGRRRSTRRGRSSTRSGTTRRSCRGRRTTIPRSRRSGPAGMPGRPTGCARALRSAAAQQLPSWNKSILDRWVKRSFERSDPTRVTAAHSGVVPHLPQLDGTDSHL